MKHVEGLLHNAAILCLLNVGETIDLAVNHPMIARNGICELAVSRLIM